LFFTALNFRAFAILLRERYFHPTEVQRSPKFMNALNHGGLNHNGKGFAIGGQND